MLYNFNYSWPLNKAGVRVADLLCNKKSEYNLQLVLHIYDPCSSERGLSGTGCSWTLGCPLGGGVLLAHTGDRLLSALLVSLTLDQSSLRSPLRSLSCIQSFASVLASGGTLPKTVYLGFSF